MSLKQLVPELDTGDVLDRSDNISRAPKRPWEKAKRKMVNILVVEHERSARGRLKEILIQCGYDVVEAPNGREALEAAGQDRIDGILLDVNLPVMDGWQVLSKLKENLKTKYIPVIMLTAYTSVENEAAGMRMGVSHFIAKPWRPETLAITVKVALRDAQRTAVKNGSEATEAGESSVSSLEPPSVSSKLIGTGGKLMPIDRVLSGGIPLGSLTFIEGPSGVGKSMLCQYFIYGGILSGFSLAYFGIEHTTESLFESMGSIGLDVPGRLQQDNFRAYPLPSPSNYEEPDSALADLAANIGHVPQNLGIILVDSITDLAQISQDRAVLGFFTSCQRQCNQGRTIILVSRSSALNENLIPRVHGVSDAHISLGAEKLMDRVVNTLEVRKINKSELNSNNRFSFQVESGVGIKIVPMSRVKA